MKFTMELTLDIPNADAASIEHYVRDALRGWGGGFGSRSPFFPGNWHKGRNGCIEIKAIKTEVSHLNFCPLCMICIDDDMTACNDCATHRPEELQRRIDYENNV